MSLTTFVDDIGKVHVGGEAGDALRQAHLNTSMLEETLEKNNLKLNADKTVYVPECYGLGAMRRNKTIPERTSM